MNGLMQQWSLTLDKILVHAARQFGDRAVVSRSASGHLQTHSYSSVLPVAKGFSAGLIGRGVAQGDRIATLMWNDVDHLAAWYGIMGIGAVVHTLNPRLHPDRIAWIARHGGAKLLVIEEEFIGLIDGVLDRLPELELVVVSTNAPSAPVLRRVETITFANFLGADDAVRWGGFAEEAAAGLCYTSGTTGDPKGVLYSHRSNFLHALAVNQPNGLAITASDVVLPVVPMFHANAWALAFIAPMAGAELVLPGRRLDGASLYSLIHEREVSVAVGVPTVWEELLRHVGQVSGHLGPLRRVVVGGSAASPTLVQRLGEEHGIDVVHAWGMTEMSPMGTITSALSAPQGVSAEQTRARALRQGGALFPVEVEVFDDAGRPCPHDDRTAGALKARGPTVARQYYGASGEVLDEDGWFDTADIAVIDQTGSVRLVDRAKDVIKSGGEWISSIELENLAALHPQVRRAAVIAIADEKWGERPLLAVESAAEPPPTPEALTEHLRPLVPKWWLPAQITYCTIPLGATGKVDKVALRRLVLSSDSPRVVSADPPAVHAEAEPVLADP